MRLRDDPIEAMVRRARLPELIGRSTWEAVARVFRNGDFDRWVDGLERLTAAKLGAGAAINFARASVVSAKLQGTDATLALVPVAISIRKHADAQSAARFLAAVPRASELLKDAASFRSWLSTMEMIAERAPESIGTLLSRLEFILERLDAPTFRAWVLAGIRSAAGDPQFRKAYFALEEATAMRAFEQASSDVLFIDVERRLRAYLVALWRLHPAIRTAAIRPGGPAPRRSAFDGLIVRVPEAYAGWRGQNAVTHYRAVLAHVGAHIMFSRERFPIGTLKPVQQALVSLIEDARVESLAAQDYPGLQRLWARYHVAEPHGGVTAELLMPRLARALIDPDYRDPDPWVSKGRKMFFDHRDDWGDPGISRKIGGLLGNDLGQMRIQFDGRAYIVQPSYRDDNSGLWDYGDQTPDQADAEDTILDSVRIEQRNDDNAKKNDPDDSEHQASRPARMKVVDDDFGVPVARYPEWDFVSARERTEWTTLVEFFPKPAPVEAGRALTDGHQAVAHRIARLVKNAKISRPERLRRQVQGDRIDLDACIRAAVDLKIGVQPDSRIYETRAMRSRDLSVLLLLDISESTRDRIRDTTTTVLQVERAAAALLSEAMAGLNDPFAVHAFCSNGRDEVRYYRVKDFAGPYDEAARRRLAGLRGGLSTRLGSALRHAGTEIESQQTHRRLILVVTDGEPSDIDVSDRDYLVEDARKAVRDLRHKGIDVFAVGLDGSAESCLARILHGRNFVVINKVEALPEKLPMLYFRLTA